MAMLFNFYECKNRLFGKKDKRIKNFDFEGHFL